MAERFSPFSVFISGRNLLPPRIKSGLAMALFDLSCRRGRECTCVSLGRDDDSPRTTSAAMPHLSEKRGKEAAAPKEI